MRTKSRRLDRVEAAFLSSVRAVFLKAMGDLENTLIPVLDPVEKEVLVSLFQPELLENRVPSADELPPDLLAKIDSVPQARENLETMLMVIRTIHGWNYSPKAWK